MRYRRALLMRSIDHRYDDPLDLIWLACARELDIEVLRASDVYASFDGERKLTLSAREHFDADDSLAQLIFHELCHALVAGERGRRRPDWGMENIDARDLEQEHACHRLQAALADRHGLRAFFAVTTEHRTYWDALPIDPLGPGIDPAIPTAREAFQDATRGPWAGPLARALARTALLAATMRELTLPADSLWRRTRPLHASGFPLGEDASQTCGGCAWSYGRDERLRCRQMGNRATGPSRAGAVGKLTAQLPGCVRFEPKLSADSCESCGACCREGFDRVELSVREWKRAAGSALRPLVVIDGFGPHLPRPDGLCVALEGAATRPALPTDRPRYRCSIYAERPRSCADFEVAGEACLTARRRVGLSP